MAARAIAAFRMIGILRRRGSVDYLHAEPALTHLVAARAIGGDAAMVHRRAGKRSEVCLCVAGLAGFRGGDVIRRRLLWHDVGEGPSGSMTGRAAACDACMIESRGYPTHR